MPGPVALPYPDADFVANHAEAFALPVTSVERLVAIDLVLRSLAASDALTGWALAGPTALHGVYLAGAHLLRVPDELTFAPTGEKTDVRLGPGALVGLLAATLPDGKATAVAGDAGLVSVAFAGATGSAVLPVRIETFLTFPPSGIAARAARTGRGFITDPRLPYHSRFGTPVTLPIALAEEILARVVLGLVAGKRGDEAARVDDLRLAFAMQGANVRDAFAGPVRAALLGSLKGANAPEDRLERLAESVRARANRCAADGALAEGLRPAGTVTDWPTFLDVLATALGALVAGA